MISIFLNILLAAFIITLVVCFIMYFPRFRCWFGSLKPQLKYKNDEKNRIAIIVPARNESQVISELLQTIKDQSYDRDYYDTFVIVKDENDETIEIAKKEEQVYTLAVQNQTCKSDALDVCFKQIMKETPGKYDAFVIVDADCMLHKDFLKEMNNAMAKGRQVIVARKACKNYLSKNRKAKTWSCHCNCLVWNLMDGMGSRYKSEHDIVTTTISTGLLIKSEVIEEIGGWPYKETMTEDQEFLHDCVLRDISTDYCDYAIIYCEDATTFRVTNKRRQRWLTGIIDTERAYKPRFDRAKLTKAQRRNVKYIITLPRVSYVYCGTCTVFIALEALLSVILYFCHNSLWLYTLNCMFAGMVILYLTFFVCSLMCIITAGKDLKISLIKKIILAIIHPFFYAKYISIGSKAIFSEKDRQWDAIERINFNKNKKSDYKKLIKELIGNTTKKITFKK